MHNLSRRDTEERVHVLVPLRVYSSVQGGRQYLIAYSRDYDQLRTYRIDYITQVKLLDITEDFNSLRKWLKRSEPHMWGVTLRNGIRGLDKVEMTVYIESDENYIIDRLNREKRCGTVEIIDEHHVKFTAEVYDASEMLPWLRTFICRIVEFHSTNEQMERAFWNDLDAVYEMYGIKEVKS